MPKSIYSLGKFREKRAFTGFFSRQRFFAGIPLLVPQYYYPKFSTKSESWNLRLDQFFVKTLRFIDIHFSWQDMIRILVPALQNRNEWNCYHFTRNNLKMFNLSNRYILGLISRFRVIQEKLKNSRN